MTDSITDFEKRLTSLGVQIDESNMTLIETYCEFLEEYNEHTNLVSNAEREVVLRDHVLDSLSLLPTVLKIRSTSSLVDIGTGAGFPGLILALANDNLQCTLVDSVEKKCRFLRQVVMNLGLNERIKVLCSRAEELGRTELRETFDFATARAIGSLPLVAELTLPLLKVNGYLLAQRSSKQIEEEKKSAPAMLEPMSGKLVEIIQLDREVLSRDVSLALIRKIGPSPKKFPRATAQIASDEKSRRKLT